MISHPYYIFMSVNKISIYLCAHCIYNLPSHKSAVSWIDLPSSHMQCEKNSS